MKKSCYQIILLLFFSCLLLNAQQAKLSFIDYDIRDGLPSNRTSCFFQDSEGFMWIGTYGGLSRFDSYKFHNYVHDPKDSTSISSNVIESIYEDKYGNIWVGTDQGINIINKKKNSIKCFNEDPDDSLSLSNRTVYTINEDNDGNFWLGTYVGLDLTHPTYNEDGEMLDMYFTHYGEGRFSKEGKPAFFNSNTTLSNGKFLIAVYPEGNFIFDPINKTFSTIKDEYDVDINQNLRLYCVLEEEDLIFLGTWGDGLITIDKKNKTIRKKKFGLKSQNEIGKFVRINNEELIIGTQGGLVIYNTKFNKFELYQSNPGEGSLSQNIVGYIYKDNDSGIWIGTALNGFNYYNPNKQGFNSVEYSENNNLLPHYGINSFDFIDDRIWLSSGDGFVNFNPKTNEWSDHYFSNQIKYSDIKEIICVNDHMVICFISTQINYFDIYKNQMVTPDYLKEFEGKNSTDIIKASNGKIYYAYESDSIVEFSKEIDYSKPIKKYGDRNFKDFQMFFNDNDGYLWLNTSRYFLKFKSKENPLDNEYEKIPFSKEGLPWNGLSFNDVLVTKDNDFWICSGQGLIYYKTKNNKFEFYTKDDGLPDNTVYAAQEDDNGFLWITTAFGLVRFNTDNKEMNVFYKEDGLPNNIFQPASSFKDPYGNLYFGGIRGFVWFNPNDILVNSKPPKIIFSGFKISNEYIKPGKNSPLQEDINYCSDIVLSHKQSDISFEWSAINYNLPEKNKFKYKLEGYNNEWIVGNDHNVSYASLPPGKYIFSVKGSNNDGFWNEKGRTLNITIKPPFWKTWFFRIALFVFVVVASLSLYAIKVRNLKIRQKILEKQVKERTAEVESQKEELFVQADNLREVNEILKERQEEIEKQAQDLQHLNATKDKFFSIIAHDLKNPFQGIIGFADILFKKLDKVEDEESREFASIISNTSKGAFNLLENLLHWSRSQTNNIKYNPVVFDLNKIVQENMEILKLNADSKGINLVSKIKKNTYAFADPNMISTIIRNLINNAIKFTDSNGSIIASAKEENGFVVIDIADTGIGIQPNVLDKLFKIDSQISKKGTKGEPGTGLGLIICQEFIQKNNGFIKVRSIVDKGSTFSIHLPVKEGATTNEIIDEIIEEKKDVKDIEVSVEEEIVEPEYLKGMRILVVEDNDDIRRSITKVLDDVYELFEAENGKQGWERAQDLIPDLIISDVMMPELDGFELSQLIKQDQLTSHIPFILLTAKLSDASQLEGLKTGADDYLTKPFDPKILRYKIRNILSTREKLKKKFHTSHSVKTDIISVSNKDEEFLNKMCTYLENNIENNEISVNDISDYMGISRGHFYRKVMGVSGLSPQEFIRTFRLKKGAEMLKNQHLSAKEVSYKVGFSNPNYFYRAFKNQFGVSTSEYLQEG